MLLLCVVNHEEIICMPQPYYVAIIIDMQCKAGTGIMYSRPKLQKYWCHPSWGDMLHYTRVSTGRQREGSFGPLKSIKY